jgi:hypothetical protein
MENEVLLRLNEREASFLFYLVGLSVPVEVQHRIEKENGQRFTLDIQHEVFDKIATAIGSEADND